MQNDRSQSGRGARQITGRRRTREVLLSYRVPLLNCPNGYGWGVQRCPEHPQAPSDSQEVTQPVALSVAALLAGEIVETPLGAASPPRSNLENSSREAFLDIRNALGLNRRPDGKQILENTAYISPLDIRFSRPATEKWFSSSGWELNEAAEHITVAEQVGISGKILACPFPPIRCIWWTPTAGGDPAWFSLDNRRLVALQKRALQTENPQKCLAQVILLDRLPDAALEGDSTFCVDGRSIDVLDGERWCWREAKGSDKEDDASTSASEGLGSPGDSPGSQNSISTAVPSPANRDHLPIVVASLERALGFTAENVALQGVPTSLEAALDLPPVRYPLADKFSTVSRPQDDALEDAWVSLQDALGMTDDSAVKPTLPEEAWVSPSGSMGISLEDALRMTSSDNCATPSMMSADASPWSWPGYQSEAADAWFPDQASMWHGACWTQPEPTADESKPHQIKAAVAFPTDEEITQRLQKFSSHACALSQKDEEITERLQKLASHACAVSQKENIMPMRPDSAPWTYTPIASVQI